MDKKAYPTMVHSIRREATCPPQFLPPTSFGLSSVSPDIRSGSASDHTGVGHPDPHSSFLLHEHPSAISHHTVQLLPSSGSPSYYPEKIHSCSCDKFRWTRCCWAIATFFVEIIEKVVAVQLMHLLVFITFWLKLEALVLVLLYKRISFDLQT